jgi:hypothetical protein
MSNRRNRLQATAFLLILASSFGLYPAAMMESAPMTWLLMGIIGAAMILAASAR